MKLVPNINNNNYNNNYNNNNYFKCDRGGFKLLFDWFYRWLRLRLTMTVSKNNKYKQGWFVQTDFQIILHKQDQELLESIQTYLKGVVKITKQGKDYINYRVKNLEGLKVIIDHFDKYPLITYKLSYYGARPVVWLYQATGRGRPPLCL